MSDYDEDPAATLAEPDGEEFAPVGTLAIMAILAAIILAIWLFMYFAVFVPRGAVS